MKLLLLIVIISSGCTIFEEPEVDEKYLGVANVLIIDGDICFTLSKHSSIPDRFECIISSKKKIIYSKKEDLQVHIKKTYLANVYKINDMYLVKIIR